MLQRVRDLKVQYSERHARAPTTRRRSPPRSSSSRKEISDIRTKTEFNGIKLLTTGAAVTFQVGAESADTIT